VIESFILWWAEREAVELANLRLKSMREAARETSHNQGPLYYLSEIKKILMSK